MEVRARHSFGALVIRFCSNDSQINLFKCRPLNEQHFWPGKSYDYNGYVDVIAAGRRHPEFGRPNMLRSAYLNELERINRVSIPYVICSSYAVCTRDVSKWMFLI